MPFTPLPTALGALLLHLSTTHHLLTNGRILGISSLLGNAFLSPIASLTTDIPVLTGIIAASTFGYLLSPKDFSFLDTIHANYVLGSWTPVVAGLLAGAGTHWSNGCTSGHMLCGLPRMSLRSLVSMLTFSVTAMVTTYLLPSSATLTSTLATPPNCPTGSFSSCFTPTHAPPNTNISIYTTLIILAISVNYLLPNVLPNVLPKENLSRAQVISSFYSGLSFATGLIMSGMSNPSKVLGFLHLIPKHPSSWDFDPSLLLVILFGLLPNFLRWGFYKYSTPQGEAKPRLGEGWRLPETKGVDVRLVGGSVLFGVSWGLMGVCPGPGVVVATVGVLRGLLGGGWGGVGLGGGYMGGFLVGRGVVRGW
ncbi:hypothetical protein EV426DRAFT_673638 [Tirmania nivea]|nr:hypothetical protein EV426DRAFT_673638 [Tirmania nivea]